MQTLRDAILFWLLGVISVSFLWASMVTAEYAYVHRADMICTTGGKAYYMIEVKP